MKPYAQILSSIDQQFEKALQDLKNDDLFHSSKTLYTKEEKKRIGYRWMNLVRPFRALKSIIRSLMWGSFFTFGSKNIFAVKYAAIVTYYNMMYDLQRSLGPHEEFIRQYLDENFRENYSTLARFMYHIRFYAVLSYPREFFLNLRGEVIAELDPIFDRKEKASIDFEKRMSLDFVNIYYYFRYRMSLILSWISKNVGGFLSRIYFTQRDGGLILESNIDTIISELKPGDICLTRRNWAATNLSIPGFWKHMSMYIGTGKYLKSTYAQYLSQLVHLEDSEHYIIEAVGTGIRISSLHGLAGHNDYLAFIRTRFSTPKIMRSISKTISELDRQYDFTFNYYSDINYVCSALVTKAYLKEYSTDEGLHISLTRIGTGITYPPNDIIKKLYREKGDPNEELSFVAFIDSSEKTLENFISDEHGLYSTLKRSRLSIFLP